MPSQAMNICAKFHWKLFTNYRQCIMRNKCWWSNRSTDG